MRALILTPLVVFAVVVAPAAGAPAEVAITSPGVYVNQGDADPFTVTADVPTGDATSVEFFRCDDASVGCGAGTWLSLGPADSEAPYSASWDVDPDGNRALRAVASNGAETGSDVINVTIDRTDPTRALTAPADGAFVAATLTLSATAADEGSGVESVVFERRPGGGAGWTTIASDASPPYAVEWDSSGLSDGDHDLRVVATDVAGNSAPSAPRSVKIDNSPPAIATLAPFEVSGGNKQFFDPGSDTLYFRPVGPGSFRLRASLSDAQSGDDRVTFPNLDGVPGWTGTGGADVTGPSPYTSPDYAWSHGAVSPNTRNITGRNGASLAAITTITIIADSEEPSGGSISYRAGYDADGTVIITTADGTDVGSGVDPASTVLERQTAPLTGGSCDTFGTWVEIGSPNSVAAGLCAHYRYRVFDRVGNQAVHTGGAVKVDTANPAAPDLTLTEASPFAVVSASGSEIFVNTAHAGTFDVGATTSDAASGIQKVRFPGPEDDTTPPFGATYDFGELAGPQTVTAFDNVGNTAGARFEVTADTAEPLGGSVSYTNGYDPDGQVTIAALAGTDALSGIDPSSTLLERKTAPLTGNTCGAFSATWSPVASPDTLAANTCAQYRYRVSDQVGNEAVYSSASVVRFDTVAPGNVTRTSITAGDHVVTLRWTLPPDTDLATIRILRWRAGGAPTQVHLAKTLSFRDKGLLNGVKYSYRLLSRDRAGNQSAGVVLTASPKSAYLLTPRDGGVLTRPPLLDWRPRTSATYYNVQLWRNGVKILSRHPSLSQFRVRSSWRHEGRTYRFGAGRYRWLVWPGFGRPSAARFGRLMGYGDFRVRS